MSTRFWIVAGILLAPISIAAVLWLVRLIGAHLLPFLRRLGLRWRRWWQSRGWGRPVTGQSPWFPGVTLSFRPVGQLPFLARVASTRITLDGRSFTFALVKQPDGVLKAYLRRQPEYVGVSAAMHESHRLLNRKIGTYYVCWRPQPTEPAHMATVLAYWIVGTCRYLDTATFPSPAEINTWLKDDQIPLSRRTFSVET